MVAAFISRLEIAIFIPIKAIRKIIIDSINSFYIIISTIIICHTISIDKPTKMVIICL